MRLGWYRRQHNLSGHHLAPPRKQALCWGTVEAPTGSHPVRELPGLPTPPFRARRGMSSTGAHRSRAAREAAQHGARQPHLLMTSQRDSSCPSLPLTVACLQMTARRHLLMKCRWVIVPACPFGPGSLQGAGLPGPLGTDSTAGACGTPEESSLPLRLREVGGRTLSPGWGNPW